MLKRTISAVILAAVIIACAYISPFSFGAILLLFALVAVYELSKAVKVHTDGKKCNPLEAVMYISTVLIYLTVTFEDYASVDKWTVCVLIATFLALMGVFVFTFPRYHTSQIMSAMAIMMYAPLLLSFGYRIRLYAEHSFIMTGLIFVVACFSDIFAYFVGSAIGKHKLAPKLSPKKSIEGAVGAIVFTGLACLGYALIFNKYASMDDRYVIVIAIMGVLGSVISQIGDLMASAIKRNYDIKDYGNIIPGHGGIMDRVDSWIVVMPVIYFLLTMVNGLY